MALSPQQIKALWISRGGDPAWAGYAAKRAMRESGGRVKIDNSHTGPGGGKLNEDGSVDVGLMGINRRVWGRDPFVRKIIQAGGLKTADGNIDAAIHVLATQGPAAWGDSGPPVPPAGSPKGPVARAVSASPKSPAPVSQAPSLQRSLLADFVSQGGADNQSAVASLATGLLSQPVQQVRQKSTPATKTPGDSFTAPGSPSDGIRVLIERANKIDAKHYPYVWGGGHGVSGKPDRGTGRDPGIGFDCSGAVSAVLGVDPRVSGQFEQWGKPGVAKGGRGVTVYANGTHVLMEIDGHFFGTSGTNPGGGAGWIPRSALSSSYLSNFTARHL